jgi:transposase, IS5 family
VQRSRRIVAQTRQRLNGGKPDSATRLVSLHDPDARPIAKGRINRPVEFGYAAQVVDNEDGIVLDYTVDVGNPADAPHLAPAIRRVTNRLATPPRAVTAAASATWSSGEPDARAASATSNTATDGPAAASPDMTAPPPGADTGCSPTTW